MNEKIRRLVAYYTKKYQTNDPCVLADYLNVIVLYMPLGNTAGYYKYIKRRKYIFINSDINEDNFCRVVLAHELGHAVLHRTENCAFIKKHTLLLTSRIEHEANLFAAYLLITNDMLDEYFEYTQEQFCMCTGYPKELIKIRLEGMLMGVKGDLQTLYNDKK